MQGNVLKWIRSLISNRSFQSRVGLDLPNKMILENGIPQGKVISPLLFEVMINDLLEVINSQHMGYLLTVVRSGIRFIITWHVNIPSIDAKRCQRLIFTIGLCCLERK